MSDKQHEQLGRLCELFLEWNSKINLSAIRDTDGVMVKHILDSLLILPFELVQVGQKVLDLGTGGGFPGLALAISYPQTEFVLVDSTAKKVNAVQDIAQQLGLENVRCVIGRAEALGRNPRYREQFDVVIARALAGFSTLLEYTLPFVKVGGHFVAYQGPELKDTWKTFEGVAEQLGGRISELKEAVLPVEEAERCFVVVEKADGISEKYPREVGIPKKSPLG